MGPEPKCFQSERTAEHSLVTRLLADEHNVGRDVAFPNTVCVPLLLEIASRAPLALPSGRLVPTPSVRDGPNRENRVPRLASQPSPGATSSTSSGFTFTIANASDHLTERCNFEHRSTRSSQKRRFPLTQGYVGEIDSAGCYTNSMRRQHDVTEFVHPSGCR